MTDTQTYEPESAPQWVRDVVENLQREHDKRVEEYIALERLLPHGLELSALRNAVSMLRENGHGYVADVIDAYVDRLAKADRTGW